MTNQPLKHRYSPSKLSAVRIAVITLILFALIILELHIYATAVCDMHDNLMIEYELTNERGWQENAAWFVNEFGMFLPMLTILLFQLLVYRKYSKTNGIMNREMGLEIIFLAILVYALLLPYIINLSNELYNAAVEAGEAVPKYKDVGLEITLIRKTAGWFIRFIVPVGLLTTYHFSQASVKK